MNSSGISVAGAWATSIWRGTMAFGDVSWAQDQRLDGLRITVGTDAEIDSLLTALHQIV